MPVGWQALRHLLQSQALEDAQVEQEFEEVGELVWGAVALSVLLPNRLGRPRR
jgi:hypothetical protein